MGTAIPNSTVQRPGQLGTGRLVFMDRPMGRGQLLGAGNLGIQRPFLHLLRCRNARWAPGGGRRFCG